MFYVWVKEHLVKNGPISIPLGRVIPIIFIFKFTINEIHIQHTTQTTVKRVGAPWPGWLWRWTGPGSYSIAHKSQPPLMTWGMTGEWPSEMPAWRWYPGLLCPNSHMSPLTMECRTNLTPGIWVHWSVVYRSLLQGLLHKFGDMSHLRWPGREVM